MHQFVKVTTRGLPSCCVPAIYWDVCVHANYSVQKIMTEPIGTEYFPDIVKNRLSCNADLINQKITKKINITNKNSSQSFKRVI